jgi:hypothetical protein
MSGQLDRARATAAQPFSALTRTAGDEPLIVDLPIPPAGANITRHAMLWSVVCLITIPSTGRPPDTRGLPPNSGLYLCPPGTPPETLAQAQTGINMLARPIPLPLNDPYLNVANVGAGWSIQMVSAYGRLGVVPTGWFLRAILVCQQAAATPGPGAGSEGVLTALVNMEDARDMSACE